MLVYALGSAGRGGPTPVTLALAGAALTALLVRADPRRAARDQQTLDSFRFWVVGSLAGRGRRHRLAGGAVHRGRRCVLARRHAPALNVLALGDDVARGLGQRIWPARVVGLAAITLLCGAATAAVRADRASSA